MNKKQFLLCKKLFGCINHHQLLDDYISHSFFAFYFYTVKNVFYSSSMNNSEFIKHKYNIKAYVQTLHKIP